MKVNEQTQAHYETSPTYPHISFLPERYDQIAVAQLSLERPPPPVVPNYHREENTDRQAKVAHPLTRPQNGGDGSTFSGVRGATEL
jgi:hypothetical protein